MPEFKKGDRVKVTTEVEVLDDRPFAQRVNAWGGTIQGYRALYDGIEVVIPASAEIEKVEPPVEVFKPGDTVRAKDNHRYVYALAHGGYTYVGPVNKGLYAKYPHAGLEAKDFTSAEFERVDIG